MKNSHLPTSKLVFVISWICFSSLLSIGEEAPELYHEPKEKRNIAGLKINGLSIGALLEVEASVGRENGENVSDITLATFELGLDAQINEWISGHVLFLWEEDGTEPINVDEGIIMLGGTDIIPWYLHAGRMYIPFGSFHSHFISDPLTLQLAETKETAIMPGFSNSLINIKIAMFNGDIDEDENQIDDFVVSLNIRPLEEIEAGLYWISDMGESDTIEGLLVFDEGDDFSYKNINGAGGFVHVETGMLIVDIEYLSGTEKFSAMLLSEKKLTPSAWNFELAYKATDNLELAAKCEGSNDFLKAPELQYGIAASYLLFEKTVLSIEYLHGTFDNAIPDRDMVTTQLGMEF